HFHLGNAFDKAGQHEKAEAALACATALAPNFAEAWYNLGNAQRLLNKKDAAQASYEKTLKLNPAHALAHNNLGMLLWKKGDARGARRRIEEGLKHHPAHVGLLLNLNEIAFEQNDLPTAFASARRVAEIKLGIAPSSTAYLEKDGFFVNRDEEACNALLALAASVMLEGKLEEADAILRGLLAENADTEEAFMLLGSIALARNALDLAEESYAQSFMLDPSNTAAPWNRAMALLTKGKLREGFRRYRWRWHALEKFKAMRLKGPMWDGRDLKGKTILVHEEQGFGDSIQMLRFMPLLKEKGARTWYYARPVLFPLVEKAPGIDRALSWNVEAKELPEGVDYVCGAMDLPGLLGIGLHNIPAKVPYLPNPRADDPAFKLEGKKKIGLVWAGNPLHKRDHERSVPLEMFEPVIRALPAQFYSLQYKPKEADLKLMEKWGIIDLAPKIKNLGDQAGFMAQLDLLITIDSAPTHLAGALGVPVWVLVTCNPDWRWLLGREDSPWYPSLRLFRQPQRGDWESVINMVKANLATQIADKNC
ncbi:MAG: tetratricopeptide repeat protein, partial [Proteobacteria bacterium]|nr:tetratricopeptide repeat protein [Pseudomonadota bacterium]